ncbi:MAG: type II secretion system F family protein [Deltaproteobacteria bacterium]|nr:type II secretion system F family protein [Deltaproteobacteria bacterium]
MGLGAALEAALRKLPLSAYQACWQQWLTAYQSGSLGLVDFDWRPGMNESRDVAKVLNALLKSGSPAGEALSDCISQLDDDRQAALEERLAAVPTRLSLVFCAFLTPAVFSILMGGLWPLLKDLSI